MLEHAKRLKSHHKMLQVGIKSVTFHPPLELIGQPSYIGLKVMVMMMMMTLKDVIIITAVKMI